MVDQATHMARTLAIQPRLKNPQGNWCKMKPLLRQWQHTSQLGRVCKRHQPRPKSSMSLWGLQGSKEVRAEESSQPRPRSIYWLQSIVAGVPPYKKCMARFSQWMGFLSPAQQPNTIRDNA